MEKTWISFVKRAESLKIYGSCFLFLMAGFGLDTNSMANAQEINWQTLQLTPQQTNQMSDLENNWQKVHQAVTSQIERDMAELKTILPTGDSTRIRQLQSQIMTNKNYLMKESMDTFLRKREMLSPNQRTLLQKMLPCHWAAKPAGVAKTTAGSAPATPQNGNQPTASLMAAPPQDPASESIQADSAQTNSVQPAAPALAAPQAQVQPVPAAAP